MTPHFITFINTCARLYGLWLNILPAATAALLIYTLARARSPPTLPPAAPPPHTHRGRQQATVHTPAHGQFHPAASRAQSEPIFYFILWVIDDIVEPSADLALSAFDTISLFMGKVNYIFSKPNLETYVTPIKIRVQRGIAQVPMPAVPKVLALFDMPYQYICPALFLLGLLAMLVPAAGVSVGLTCLAFAGCTTAVGSHRMGVVENDENVGSEAGSRPQIDVMSIAPLQEQT